MNPITSHRRCCQHKEIDLLRSEKKKATISAIASAVLGFLGIGSVVAAELLSTKVVVIAAAAPWVLGIGLAVAVVALAVFIGMIVLMQQKRSCLEHKLSSENILPTRLTVTAGDPVPPDVGENQITTVVEENQLTPDVGEDPTRSDVGEDPTRPDVGENQLTTVVEENQLTTDVGEDPPRPDVGENQITTVVEENRATTPHSPEGTGRSTGGGERRTGPPPPTSKLSPPLPAGVPEQSQLFSYVLQPSIEEILALSAAQSCVDRAEPRRFSGQELLVWKMEFKELIRSLPREIQTFAKEIYSSKAEKIRRADRDGVRNWVEGALSQESLSDEVYTAFRVLQELENRERKHFSLILTGGYGRSDLLAEIRRRLLQQGGSSYGNSSYQSGWY